MKTTVAILSAVFDTEALTVVPLIDELDIVTPLIVTFSGTPKVKDVLSFSVTSFSIASVNLLTLPLLTSTEPLFSPSIVALVILLDKSSLTSALAM